MGCHFQNYRLLPSRSICNHRGTHNNVSSPQDLSSLQHIEISWEKQRKASWNGFLFTAVQSMLNFCKMSFFLTALWFLAIASSFFCNNHVIIDHIANLLLAFSFASVSVPNYPANYEDHCMKATVRTLYADHVSQRSSPAYPDIQMVWSLQVCSGWKWLTL